jgi:hypothetical protein
MAIFKEVVRGDGSGIAEYYRVVNGNVYNVSYDVVTNKPRINGIELIGDISVTDLVRNEGFLQQESDPTVPEHIKLITEGDIIKWQASVDADYVTSVIGEAISNISQFSLEPVDVLPTENIKTNIIYAVPSENTKLKNARDEYVYLNGDWECIGTTAVDLGNYYTKTEVEDIISRNLDEAMAYIGGNYYTKEEIDNNYYGKEEINNGYYTKEEIDNNFYGKEEISNGYYTKAEIDDNYYSKDIIDAIYEEIMSNMGGSSGVHLFNTLEEMEASIGGE